MYKILFLSIHRPNRSPSQRFRYEQYLSFFEENGFHYELSYLIENQEDDYLFYSENQYLGKLKVFLKSSIKRFREVISNTNYDILFIQRECYMLGTTFFERQFSKKGKIIFDFDDAIWLQNISKANSKLSFLKNPKKTAQLIRLSDMIFAGNEYLATYAQKFNPNVKIIPTTIDTCIHHNQIKKHIKKKKITIGWTGTHSTLKYLSLLEEIIPLLIEKYNVDFLVICDKKPDLTWKNCQFIKWSSESEIEDLLKIDIGVMPLFDTEWAKGKCGFKILQYMALEIPAIASPVGVNEEIIQHNQNGYLAATTKEWIKYLSQLIENVELRGQMGQMGRQTVVDKYSVEANKHLYLKYFKELLD